MALEEVGVRLTAKGKAEYIASLKSATSALKGVQIESQLAVAQLGHNAKITDTYRTKMNGLSRELVASKDKTSLLRAEQTKLKSVYEKLPQDVKAANEAYKNSGKETNKLKKRYEELNKTLGENHADTQKVKSEWEKSQKTTSQLKKEYNGLALELKNTEKELASLPGSINKAELATQKLRNEAQKLHEEYRNNGGWAADYAKGLKETGGKITQFGDSVSSLGSTLTRNVTTPILLGGTAAIKAAMDWETAFTGVRKTNDEVVDANGKVIYSYADLENGLRGLAKVTPLSHAEIAGLAETLGQLGIPTDEVVHFTETIAKMGVSTNLSSEEAATAMAQFLNITQPRLLMQRRQLLQLPMGY